MKKLFALLLALTLALSLAACGSKDNGTSGTNDTRDNQSTSDDNTNANSDNSTNNNQEETKKKVLTYSWTNVDGYSYTFNLFVKNIGVSADTKNAKPNMAKITATYSIEGQIMNTTPNRNAPLPLDESYSMRKQGEDKNDENSYKGKIILISQFRPYWNEEFLFSTGIDAQSLEDDHSGYIILPWNSYKQKGNLDENSDKVYGNTLVLSIEVDETDVEVTKTKFANPDGWVAYNNALGGDFLKQ